MRSLPLALLLVACTGPREDGVDKYGRSPELAARYAAAVERRELLRGMHKDEIRQVMQGDPERVSRQRRGDNTYTVWEYRSRSLDLYLDSDGYLMHWRAPY